jgi:outer membrane protein OmpA-like peptidoglycan-associated protein
MPSAVLYRNFFSPAVPLKKGAWYCFCLLIWSIFSISVSAQKVAFSQIIPTCDSLDTAPVLAPDGSTLLLSRSLHKANFGVKNAADIWQCQYLGDEQWSHAFNLGLPLNTRNSDEAIAINLDKSTIYTRLNLDKKNALIGVSRLQGRFWSEPQAMKVPNWDSLFVCHFATVSQDGAVLLLALSHPKHLADGVQLYHAQRQSELSWGPITAFEAPINSAYDETSAFLAADGESLYFSSNRPGGEGGQDIYLSRRNDKNWNTWSTPENLGAVLNTPADEVHFNISALGDVACWQQKKGEKQNRLWWGLPEPHYRPRQVVLVKGRLLSPKQGEAITAQIQWYPYRDPKPQESAQTIRTNAQGQFQLLLPRNTPIMLQAIHPQYFSSSYLLMRPGGIPEGLDQENEGRLDLLDKNSAYQQAEKQIEAYKLQANRLRSIISDLELAKNKAQMRIAAKNRDSLLSIAPGSTLDMDLQNLRKAYRDAQRQEMLAAHHETGPNVNSAGSFTSQTSPVPVEFDDFFTYASRQLLSSYFPQVMSDFLKESQEEELKRLEKRWSPVDKELLGGFNIKSIRDSLNQGYLKRNLIEGLQMGQLFKPFDWQFPFYQKLNGLLQPRLTKDLQSAFKTEARQYLQSSLNLLTRQLQVQNLRNKIETKIKEQLILEKQVLGNPQAETLLFPELPDDTLLVSADAELIQDIQLFSPQSNNSFILQNLVFPPNAAVMSATILPELSRLFAFWQKNQHLGLEIRCHTNSLCTHSFAEDLTARRAEVLAKWLMEAGIPAQQIRFKGMGKQEPLTENDDSEGRLENQRVEISFFKLE